MHPSHLGVRPLWLPNEGGSFGRLLPVFSFFVYSFLKQIQNNAGNGTEHGEQSK